MHVLYILKSQSSNKLYIGVTNNLQRRFREHNSGESKSTAAHKPWQIVYCEVYRSKLDALERERKLKQFKNSYSALKTRIRGSLEDS